MNRYHIRSLLLALLAPLLVLSFWGSQAVADESASVSIYLTVSQDENSIVEMDNSLQSTLQALPSSRTGQEIPQTVLTDYILSYSWAQGSPDRASSGGTPGDFRLPSGLFNNFQMPDLSTSDWNFRSHYDDRGILVVTIYPR